MRRNTGHRGERGLAAVIATCAVALVACGPRSAPGQADAPATGTRSQKTTHHATDVDGRIPLLDAAGNRIARGSTTPYSPERTCGGACHDTAKITLGYHFQQGRTNPDGTIRVSDAFNPTKFWLLSDGMYGKT